MGECSRWKRIAHSTRRQAMTFLAAHGKRRAKIAIICVPWMFGVHLLFMSTIKVAVRITKMVRIIQSEHQNVWGSSEFAQLISLSPPSPHAGPVCTHYRLAPMLMRRKRNAETLLGAINCSWCARRCGLGQQSDPTGMKKLLVWLPTVGSNSSSSLVNPNLFIHSSMRKGAKKRWSDCIISALALDFAQLFDDSLHFEATRKWLSGVLFTLCFVLCSDLAAIIWRRWWLRRVCAAHDILSIARMALTIPQSGKTKRAHTHAHTRMQSSWLLLYQIEMWILAELKLSPPARIPSVSRNLEYNNQEFATK